MSYRKTADLAVKVGEYTKNGETKGRYENIGQILDNGDNELLMLKRTFNPAGVPNPDGKDSIIVSRFPVRDEAPQRAAPKAAADEPYSDSIPF